jgi:hypothetical protein
VPLLGHDIENNDSAEKQKEQQYNEPLEYGDELALFKQTVKSEEAGFARELEAFLNQKFDTPAAEITFGATLSRPLPAARIPKYDVTKWGQNKEKGREQFDKATLEYKDAIEARRKALRDIEKTLNDAIDYYRRKINRTEASQATIDREARKSFKMQKITVNDEPEAVAAAGVIKGVADELSAILDQLREEKGVGDISTIKRRQEEFSELGGIEVEQQDPQQESEGRRARDAARSAADQAIADAERDKRAADKTASDSRELIDQKTKQIDDTREALDALAEDAPEREAAAAQLQQLEVALEALQADAEQAVAAAQEAEAQLEQRRAERQALGQRGTGLALTGQGLALTGQGLLSSLFGPLASVAKVGAQAVAHAIGKHMEGSGVDLYDLDRSAAIY